MTHDTAVAELPETAAPDFHESSIKPSKLERVRVTLARTLVLRHTYGLNIGLWLAPDSHPWKALAVSAREDFRNVTHVALRPRGPEGIEIAMRDLEEVDSRSDGIRRWLWRGAFLYLLLDAVSIYIPGPLSEFGVDDTIRLFDRIASWFPTYF